MEQAPVTKFCKKCSTEKDINFFGLKKHCNGKYYIKSWCKKCLVDDERKRIEKIEDKNSFYKTRYKLYKHLYKKHSIIYYAKNKQNVIVRSAEWANNNPEKKKTSDKNIRKSQKERLANTHIKREIVKHSKGILKYSDVPQELVELKRKQLKLKRDAKKAKENNGN